MPSEEHAEGVLQKAWLHKVPLAFLAGAVILTVTTTADLVMQIDSPLIGSPWGFALAAFYLVIGGAYEWTIKQEQRFERQYRETKEILNEYDDNDV